MPRTFALLLVLSLPVLAADAGGARLEFSQGWIRSAPPTASVLAGYGRFRNPGDRELVVAGVRSPAFARAALHEMTMEQGVMKMRELPRLAVAPNAELPLEPGGIHLMLFEPKRPLKPGERVAVTFELDTGATLGAELEVR